MFTRKLNRIIFSVGIISFCFTISGCATGPQVAQPIPTITINTIPSGADISVQGNYIGVSPVTIPMPSVPLRDLGQTAADSVPRSNRHFDKTTWQQIAYNMSFQPLQIQAHLNGYETKDITFGNFHAPMNKVVQPLFSYSAVTATTQGYYTFLDQITIKLSPK
jgi:hypothetical protein